MVRKIIGCSVECSRDKNGTKVTMMAKVLDVYTELLASGGSNEYKELTMYLLVDIDGNAFHVYPRDIQKIHTPDEED